MENIQRPKTLILAFGAHPSKSSLLTRYAHQNKYTYISGDNKQNIFQHILHQQAEVADRNIILNDIPNNLHNFLEAEKHFKTHQTIILFFRSDGQPYDVDQEPIARYYQKLGILRVISLKGANLEQNYKQLKRKLLNRVIFVYGAPRSGKTQLSHKIADALGYKYVYFNDLKKELGDESEQISLVNKLLRYLSQSNEHLVIDGFFKTKAPLAILAQYLEPVRILHIQSSNDEIQTQLQQIKDLKLKHSKIQQFQSYLDNKDGIVESLKSKPYFQNIYIAQAENIIESLKPTILYMKLSNNQFIDEVAAAWDGTHINIEDLAAAQVQRQRKTIGDNNEEKVKYLKRLISSLNGKIILSGFSDKLEDFLELEKSIGQIRYYFLFNDAQLGYSQVITPEMYYLGRQKLIRLDDQNLSSSLVLSYLDRRNPYILISGPESSGKTEIAKIIARDYGYKHIEFEPYMAEYKEKNPSEEGEQLPTSKIIAHFKQLLSSNKIKYILQGLPYLGNDLAQWIKEVGYPTSINLRLDNHNWLVRYRKKNDIDPQGQVTQQDNEKISTAQQKNAAYVKSLEEVYEKFPNVKLFQFDCNAPLISLENFLPLILKPRIYLIAENNQPSDVLFLNIALKYSMSIFDLSKTNLRQIEPLIRSSAIQRDIILYNYSLKDTLVSDDIYYIEKNLGTIRFVCVWAEQQKEFKDPLMKLQRPVVEVKKKVAQQGQENEEGAPQQESPVQELDENGEPKKPKIDIYSYQWTETGTAKSLTQWFIHSKKPIREYVFQQSNPTQVFEDFELIISELNRDRTVNIYTVIT